MEDFRTPRVLRPSRTALHRACANGHDQVVAYLISQGAAVEVEAGDGHGVPSGNDIAAHGY